MANSQIEFESLPGAAQLPAPTQKHVVAAPVAAPATPPAPATAAFNVATLLGVLRRRWFLTLCLGTPLAAGAAFVAWSLIPAPYTGFAEIRIRSGVGPIPGTKARGPQHKEIMQAQKQLIRDRHVIDLALKEKGVAKIGLLKQQKDPHQWLEENLKVVSRGTEFFRVTLSGVNAHDLDKILDAITAAYFTEVVQKDRKSLQQRVTIYEKLMSVAVDNLQRKRNTLRTIAGGANQSQLSEKQKSLLEYRLGLLKQIDEIDIKIFKLEVLIAHREKSKGTAKKATVPDELIQDLLKSDSKLLKAVELEETTRLRFEALKKNLDETYPSVVKAKERWETAKKDLDELRTKRTNEIRESQLNALKSQEEAAVKQMVEELAFLKTSKEALKKKLDSTEEVDHKQGIANFDLIDQQNEITRSETFINSLKSDITRLQAKLDFDDEQPRILLWRPSEPPRVPNKKKKYMGTAMAGLGSFGLVFLSIAFLDIRSKRVNSIRQLIEQIGIPVLGTIPLIPRSASTRKKGRWAGRARYWHSVLTESIDASRTMLLRDANADMKVFMVASAASGEGKTTTSCHLATSLARAGNHVLLIDGDLRRPFVHRTFDITAGPGLAEVIRGEHELDAVLQPSGVARLPILPAGKVDQKALGLLAQGRLGDCLEKWRNQFDYIVIDSSPILPVADGSLIARHTDGVLFVVRRDISRESKVLTACERLSLLGVPLLGAIAIGLEQDGYSYQSYYGYSTPVDPSA